MACNGILNLAHDLENLASFHSICYQEIFGNSRQDTIILRSEQVIRDPKMVLTIPYQRIVFNVKVPSQPTNEIFINTCSEGLGLVWKFFLYSWDCREVRLKFLEMKCQSKLVNLIFKAKLGCLSITIYEKDADEIFPKILAMSHTLPPVLEVIKMNSRKAKFLYEVKLKNWNLARSKIITLNLLQVYGKNILIPNSFDFEMRTAYGIGKGLDHQQAVYLYILSNKAFPDVKNLRRILRFIGYTGYTIPEDMQCDTIIVAYSGNVIRKTNCILHPNVLEIGTTSLKQLYCNLQCETLVLEVGKTGVFEVWMNLCQAFTNYELTEVLRMRLGNVNAALRNDDSRIEVDIKDSVDGDLARAAVWAAALGLQSSESLTDMTMN